VKFRSLASEYGAAARPQPWNFPPGAATFRRRPARKAFSVATGAAVAWGALLFGAPYPWTYLPLLAACTAIGLWGLWRSRHEPRAQQWPIVGALGAILAAVLLQLVPIPQSRLSSLSPAADSYLRRHDAEYAAAVFLQSTDDADAASPASAVRHPLSIAPDATRRGLLFLVCFGIFLTGASRGLRPADVKQLAAGLFAIGTLVAIVGIAHRGSTSGRIYGIWQPQFAQHPFGPFVNRNHFAGWMLMCIPVCLGYLSASAYRVTRRVRQDWHARMVWLGSPEANRLVLMAFAILIMVFSVALTLSRSGVACLAVSLPLMTWLALSRTRRASRRLIAFGWVVLLLVVTASWAGLDAIALRFASAEGGPLGGRVAIWRDGLRILHDFVWTGTGMNTFGAISRMYQTADLQFRYLEAHNDYLQILLEGGLLVGLPALFLMAALASAIWKAFRRAKDDETTFRIRAGAVTGIIAVALQETVDFSLQMPGNAALFTLLCAIALHDANEA
jgi:O-antigen ligase